MSLSTTSKCFLNTSRDGDSTTSLGSLGHCLSSLSENFFLISNLNPPWCNLRTFPLILFLEEVNPHLATTSFQAVLESCKLSPEPPFLQTEQFQLLQLLPIRPVLQTLHSFYALLWTRSRASMSFLQ